MPFKFKTKDSSDSDDSDESLNLSSQFFNPLRALYSPKVKLPDSKAPIQDNLTKFNLSEDGTLTIKGKAIKKTPVASEPSTSFQRFQPHQEPIQRIRKVHNNVVKRMNNATGPLSLIRDLMENRNRVMVETRGENSVRGFCIGYVAAFDKHLNLAMEDVIEVWTRKKRLKTPTAFGSAPRSITRTALGIPVPSIKTEVRKTFRKWMLCERHVPQLMLRGENVSMVLNYSEELWDKYMNRDEWLEKFRKRKLVRRK
uniref:Sm domain-containing protein n=1 Tax=Clastoptera arizonana TaxID=38151 RepID=A0A1B6CYT2_9HEMI